MAREYVLHPVHPTVNLQIDYAHELNPQQLAAVGAPPGPALVLAGAGAGKTRTLIYRVAYLIEQGIKPERILLLTFTNKAAKEMMRRVTDLLGGDLVNLWGGTFHSIGHRVLRRHAEAIGCKRDFTILDSEDSKDLLKTVISESDIDTKELKFPKADVVQDILSLAVNTQRSVTKVLEDFYEYFLNLAPHLEGLGQKYAQRKRQANVMDFDDLLVLWLKLLQENEEVREQYQRRFEVVLVDEYQDTNKIQAEVIDQLAGRHQNLMVVGDDSQSIYSWRGANFQNILEFPKRYPQAKIYKIETNYRSTPEILAVANAAIASNQKQFPKELAASRKQGIKPILVVCQDAGQQAVFVAQRLLELREEGTDLTKMAVLYRSHFHAMELQMELTRRGIPFSITSGPRFFEQAHLKDAISHLKLVCNSYDETAFRRLAMLLPGIGGKAAAKLWSHFQHQLQLAQAGEKKSLAAMLQGCAGMVPKKAAIPWANFATTISQLDVPSAREHPGEALRIVLDGGYDEYLKETYPNYRSRLEDLEQLANFASQFPTLEEFLSQLSLLTNLEAEDDQPSQPDTERVKLSTIHQAKGLEFDVVFIIMLCDGMFPSHRSLEREENEEEERRLFYVSVTRARNELYLSYPLFRAAAGQGNDMWQQPSRFLKEIPVEMLEAWDLKQPSSEYE